MSILSMPTFSSAPISYCVMSESSPSVAAPAPLVGAVQIGTYSCSGPGAMTTPAACTDRWREMPSIRELSCISRSNCGFSFTRSRSSSTFCTASGIVRLYAGPEGMSLVSLSASPGGIRSTRATSLTAARAFIVPKVTIWPTLSRP